MATENLGRLYTLLPSLKTPLRCYLLPEFLMHPLG